LYSSSSYERRQRLSCTVAAIAGFYGVCTTKSSCLRSVTPRKTHVHKQNKVSGRIEGWKREEGSFPVLRPPSLSPFYCSGELSLCTLGLVKREVERDRGGDDDRLPSRPKPKDSEEAGPRYMISYTSEMRRDRHPSYLFPIPSVGTGDGLWSGLV